MREEVGREEGEKEVGKGREEERKEKGMEKRFCNPSGPREVNLKNCHSSLQISSNSLCVVDSMRDTLTWKL